jgi:hypothetical protein
MLTRILLFVSIAYAAFNSQRTFILEESDVIEMYPKEILTIDSPSRPNSMNMWVVGRFPSEKIVPLEGRFGDRYSERTTEDGRLIQTWSIAAGAAKVGDSLPMEFWYLNPLYAEQYYNDPEAYEAMHEEKVETRVLTFKIINRDL